VLINVGAPYSLYQLHSSDWAIGYLPLSVTATHAAAVESLPPIHADPFDRMLVAQALAEPLRLLTADRTVARYSDSIVLV
jgi:PIN domain nuclease of toxin-antitoxin system